MMTRPAHAQPAPWQLRTVTLRWEKLPLVMGIVNVTPNSFSDGGRFFDPARALEHARELVRQGADILDVGGESTQPYASPVDADEELRRVLPVVEQLCRHVTIPVSIDTAKAVVARAAIACGVEIINDVTGLEGDPDMVPLACESRVGVCVMHMQGTPATMQDNPDLRRRRGGHRRVLASTPRSPRRGRYGSLANLSRPGNRVRQDAPRTTSNCCDTAIASYLWGVPCWWGLRGRASSLTCSATSRWTAPPAPLVWPCHWPRRACMCCGSTTWAP